MLLTARGVMENVEREQLYEFIDQSKEDLINIQQAIENGHITHASYHIGRLVFKHETLIEALEEDCNDCNDESTEQYIARLIGLLDARACQKK